RHRERARSGAWQFGCCHRRHGGSPRLPRRDVSAVNLNFASASREIFGRIRELGRQAALTGRMQQYARGFFSGILVQVFAVVALIEAIFLAERFTIVFRDAADKDANLLDIFLLLGCTSTEIFDLALSIAVLIAVYSIVLRMRENRELLALFAAGS